MGRGRGKGKKQLKDDAGSGEGEDEKMPSRRRGRPQKPLKDDIEVEDEVDKIEEEEENSHDSKSSGLNRSDKNLAGTENGRKRKRIRPSQVNENADLAKEENGVGIKTNAPDLIKSVGFRPNGSRRKNKPRRAAEVGVECK